MAYWYQTEPHAPLPPLPHADERRVLDVKIPPEAVPAESLAVERTGDGLAIIVPVARPDLYEAAVYPIGGPGAGAQTIVVTGGARRAVDLESVNARTILPAAVLDTVRATEAVQLELPGADTLALAAVRVLPVQRWAHEWNVVGPFASPQRPGTERSPAIDSVYGPERDPALKASYTGLDGRRVRWRKAEADENGRVVFNTIFTPNNWVAAYAQAFLYSPDARETTLLLGADDAHELWVNGEPLSEREGRHISTPDDVEVPVRLRAGWNRVLVKVADLDGGWALLLRAADPTGELRWAARP